MEAHVRFDVHEAGPCHIPQPINNIRLIDEIQLLVDSEDQFGQARMGFLRLQFDNIVFFFRGNRFVKVDEIEVSTEIPLPRQESQGRPLSDQV